MAELALGVVGAAASAHVAIKACRALTDTCSDFKYAEGDIRERSIRLRSNCLRLQTQLDMFCKITDDINQYSQEIQIEVIEILAQKIHNADAKLRKICSKENGKSMSIRERTNYTLHKSSLDNAISDIESWQQLSFYPLWFEIMRSQSQPMDKELRRLRDNKDETQDTEVIAATLAVRQPLKHLNSSHVFLPPEKLEGAKYAEVTFSSVRLVNIDGKWRILDTSLALSKDEVRELVVRLKNADPVTFALLRCLGAVHHEATLTYRIIFRVPDNMTEPDTLRAKLLQKDTTHSLSDRFRLATQLARAVSSIHTFEMVHKSIRPENILVFQDQDSTLGSAFLLGFNAARNAAMRSRLVGDLDWEKNLYRHPERQGAELRLGYVMQHDIYSLGVCLLEIGLWTSFVDYTPEQIPRRSRLQKVFPESATERDYPDLVKSRLLSLARGELPGKMGTKYASVVESCLTCLDLGNEDFGESDELEEGGVPVALRYIEKVLMQLSSISV